MKQIFRLFTFLVLTLSMVACSSHWRDADHGITAKDMEADLQEAQSVASSFGASGSNLELFNSLVADESSAIYYAKPGDLGPVSAVVSFEDFDFIHKDLNGYEVLDFEDARVFFVDGIKEGRRRFALLLQVKIIGDNGRGYTQVFVDNSFKFTDSQFVASMTGQNNEEIYIHIFDVFGEDFTSAIQLKIDQMGHISTLIGFN